MCVSREGGIRKKPRNWVPRPVGESVAADESAGANLEASVGPKEQEVQK